MLQAGIPPEIRTEILRNSYRDFSPEFLRIFLYVFFSVIPPGFPTRTHLRISPRICSGSHSEIFNEHF